MHDAAATTAAAAAARAGRLTRMAGSDLAQDLGRRALTRAHRAVHVAVPVRRGLGAGPVDPSARPADRRAELHQRAGTEDAHRAAARPDLGDPAELEVVLRLARGG